MRRERPKFYRLFFEKKPVDDDKNQWPYSDKDDLDEDMFAGSPVTSGNGGGSGSAGSGSGDEKKSK